jgi:hypothetical protein
MMSAVLACYFKKGNSILDVVVVAAKTNVLDVEVSSPRGMNLVVVEERPINYGSPFWLVGEKGMF